MTPPPDPRDDRWAQKECSELSSALHVFLCLILMTSLLPASHNGRKDCLGLITEAIAIVCVRCGLEETQSPLITESALPFSRLW